MNTKTRSPGLKELASLYVNSLYSILRLVFVSTILKALLNLSEISVTYSSSLVRSVIVGLKSPIVIWEPYNTLDNMG